MRSGNKKTSGAGNANAKFTDEMIRSIRRMWRQKKNGKRVWLLKELAAYCKVHESTMWRIITTNKKWQRYKYAKVTHDTPKIGATMYKALRDLPPMDLGSYE